MGDHIRPSRKWRRISAVVTAFVVLTALGAAPAQAYSEKYLGRGLMEPYMVFEINRQATLKSKLTAYVSVGRKRYRLTMRGGSGNGTKSQCVRNKGRLPAGFYDPRDEDSGSTLKYIKNKTWGNAVVRGPVWELGTKKCTPASGERQIKRSDLYIHSQGASGWSGNYVSNGCIKVSQNDRTKLKQRWSKAYRMRHGMLMVY
ncbi:hypothetical protein GCM10020358_24010 [Amorphoplanes nipponensis]|uniref:L,D-transpeptidase catalytic domain n=1 Tax=Actinoplanes nipponensis TaxID=135950 RepID=A0A919JKY1_9ACTN|nr:tlde1 domain-containing protein [Actinoplanes nipponensis]GIE51061.1 hypothetical protein Ani05nite_45950 [Actinoplanes nipponensis]